MEYGRRAGKLMDTLVDRGVEKVVWIGLPCMREEDLNADQEGNPLLLHTANYCVSERVCDICKDWDIELPCERCGETRRRTFKGPRVCVVWGVGRPWLRKVPRMRCPTTSRSFNA